MLRKNYNEKGKEEKKLHRSDIMVNTSNKNQSRRDDAYGKNKIKI